MTTPPVYDAFLSYNSLDHAIVERVAKELATRQCKCFVDRWYLQPGRDWVDALERALSVSQSVAIFTGPHELGRWQQRERAWALDRLAEAADFPVIPVLLPGCEPPLGFMKQLMWIDLRNDPADSAQLDALAAAIRGEEVERNGQLEPRATISPYRGLLAFREEDSEFFFGREKYTDDLLALVQQHSMVAVTGASGSGKSSVVRAGLVPRLRQRGDGDVWDILTMFPRENPLHSLADIFLPLVEPDLSGIDLIRKRNALADDLEHGRVPLRDLAMESLKQQPGTDRLLLVVDQWEELYTNCKNDNHRNRFIEELLKATSAADSPLSVVLTVRWDFYGAIFNTRTLLDRLQHSRLDLGPMNRDELRSAIEEPGNKVGLTFQDGLVDRILDDAGDEPGRLPLLEFLLEELWKSRRGDGQLTHEAYGKLGRLTGAIATRAEAVFTQLSREEQTAAESLFRGLVQAGAKTDEDTRRRADLPSLDATAQEVARKLADARLLVTTRMEATSASGGEANGNNIAAGETIEVAHEELLRRWERLKRWVNKDREFLQWRSRLAPLLGAYQRDPATALLRGHALQESKTYVPSRSAELDKPERDFVQTSQHADLRRKQIAGGIFVVLACVGLFVAYLGRLEMRQRETERLVERLLNPAASTVEPSLEDLDVYRDLAIEQLRLTLQDQKRDWIHHVHAAYGLAQFDAAGPEQVEFLLDKLPDLSPDEGRNLINALSRIVQNGERLNVQEIIETRIAAAEGNVQMRTRILTVAAEIGFTEPVSQDCMLRDNPWRRTSFIHTFSNFPGDLNQVAELLSSKNLPSETRSALCVAVGKLGNDGSEETQDALKELYQNAPDGGTHSAARWALLEQGVSEEQLQQWIGERPQVDGAADWEHLKDVAGLTMILIPERRFALGSVTDDVGGGEDSGWTGDPTGDDKAENFESFWMSDREISIAQFAAVLPHYEDVVRDNAAKVQGQRRLPIVYVTWYDAIDFCNELSEKQDLQPFYLLSDTERYENGRIITARVDENDQDRAGFRLPTEKEWEYACRALSAQGYCYGEGTTYLADYAVFNSNHRDLCGQKIPNAWGLFDMHGNVWEWCSNRWDPADKSDNSRVSRCGSFDLNPRNLRSASRYRSTPGGRGKASGFRISRTAYQSDL